MVDQCVVKKSMVILFVVACLCSVQASAVRHSFVSDNVPAEVKKPNIVIILADDMGYGDMACQNENSKIPTPNLDELAKQGLRFTDGHSSAGICSPSRYSLLTGRYYWRNEMYRELGWKVVNPWIKPMIEEGRLTLPQMLRDQGYHTACIGKWHLGFEWQAVEGGKKSGNYKDLDYTKKVFGGPITRGFDYFFGYDSPNCSYTFIENDQHTEIPTQEPYNSYAKGWTRKTAKNWTFEGMLPAFAQRSVDYIKEQSNKDKTFFLYLALNAPHSPIAPAKEFIGKSKAGPYGDFIYQIDWHVGEIVKTLKEQGVYDDTVIIFSSDNGSPERDGNNYVGRLKSLHDYGHYANGHLKGMKADLWEGGHRVPFVVRWPGITNTGTTSDVLVSQSDIMRTVANYLQVDLPADAAEDSFDIMPALKGENIKGHDPLVIYDGKVDENNSEDPLYVVTVRSGKWKYLNHKGPSGFSKHAGVKASPDDPEGQLYDMEKDPEERDNLYNDLPDKVKELEVILEEIKKSGRSQPLANK